MFCGTYTTGTYTFPSQWQCETVKRGYGCYEKAAEVRTATGDRIAGSYHCRWNQWKDAQLPRRKDVECDRKDGLGEIEEKRIRSFYLL